MALLFGGIHNPMRKLVLKHLIAQLSFSSAKIWSPSPLSVWGLPAAHRADICFYLCSHTLLSNCDKQSQTGNARKWSELIR